MNRRKFLTRLSLTLGGAALLASYPLWIERRIVLVNTYRIPVPRLPGAFSWVQTGSPDRPSLWISGFSGISAIGGEAGQPHSEGCHHLHRRYCGCTQFIPSDRSGMAALVSPSGAGRGLFRSRQSRPLGGRGPVPVLASAHRTGSLQKSGLFHTGRTAALDGRDR